MGTRVDIGTRLTLLTLPVALVAAVAVSLGAAAPGDSAPVSAEAVSFATDIMPIFERSCMNCHGGEYEGEQRIEAALDLRTYEALMAGSEFGSVVEAGDPDASILLEMIAVGDMPEEGDPLTPEEIELVRTWISEGAENN